MPSFDAGIKDLRTFKIVDLVELIENVQFGVPIATKDHARLPVDRFFYGQGRNPHLPEAQGKISRKAHLDALSTIKQRTLDRHINGRTLASYRSL